MTDTTTGAEADQLDRADLKTMTAAEIVAARKDGRLDSLLNHRKEA